MQVRRLLYIVLLLALAIGLGAPSTGQARRHARHKHHKKHHRHHRARHRHHRRHHARTTTPRTVPRPAPAAAPRPAAPPPPKPPVPPSTSTPAPPAEQQGPAAASAWDRPQLTDPATAVIDATHTNLVLDPNRDYVITASAAPLPKGVSIWGGRNVVLDEATLNIAGASGALTLKSQTGEIWIHNVHLAGSQLLEGIDLDERQPNATVVLRNVLIDTVHGSYETNHADLLQTWAGPARLLIDGLTGSTDYQGFFLLPRQYNAAGPWPTVFDFRHVNIDNHGGYAFWRDSGNPYPQYVDDVYVNPNPLKLSREWWLWPKPSTGDLTWAGVIGASPPGGDFVVPTAGGAAGRADLPAPVALPGEGI